MSAYITSLSTNVPSFRIDQKDVKKFMIEHMASSDVEAHVINKIFSASNIESRYSVLPDYAGYEKSLYVDVDLQQNTGQFFKQHVGIAHCNSQKGKDTPVMNAFVAGYTKSPRIQKLPA